MASREDCIYFARLAEQGERYDDMIKNMKQVANVSIFVYKLLSRLVINSLTKNEICYQ